MTKELTWSREVGPDDTLFTFVYEVEPYSPGGRDEPPSGGNARINEIRIPHPDGDKVIPPKLWEANGFDDHTLENIEGMIYDDHCEMEESRRQAAIEDRADELRDLRRGGL